MTFEVCITVLELFVIQMELAMQLISNDSNLGSDKVQDLKDFTSKSLA